MILIPEPPAVDKRDHRRPKNYIGNFVLTALCGTKGLLLAIQAVE